MQLVNADHNFLALQHGLVQPIGDPIGLVSDVDGAARWPRCRAGVADAMEPGHAGVLVKRRGISAEVEGATVYVGGPKLRPIALVAERVSHLVGG